MTDCEVPAEEYYAALAEDTKKRHPKASKVVLEHLGALEPFLDTSIVAGFSYGVDKASVAVSSGKSLARNRLICQTVCRLDQLAQVVHASLLGLLPKDFGHLHETRHRVS